MGSDAPSGRIWIAGKGGGDGPAVSVTDWGPGISDELAARVFEPFFTTKPEGQGTGLGLSICQGIVKEHGGRLTLETRARAGATFTVELPLPAPAPRPAVSPAPPPDSNPLTLPVPADQPHL